MKIQKKWKIIMIIGLILFIVFLMHLIRNYIIVSKIAQKQGDLKNYTLIIENYTLDQDKEDKVIIEQNYKDGKMIQILRKNDNETCRYWYDEESKELISILNTDELIATIEKNSTGPFVFQLSSEYSNIKDKINAIFSSAISYEELNGEKCYVLNKGKEIKDYISVESGRILKRVNCDNVLEYKTLDVNKLNDEDVSRPNLSDYEIKYS